MKAIFFIQDVYSITGIGTIPVGTVKEGILKIGMKLNVSGRLMQVKSIEQNHRQITEAKAGENVGFSLKNGDYNSLKQLVKTEIELSGDKNENMPQEIETQQSIEPEGAFSFLKKIFKRNN